MNKDPYKKKQKKNTLTREDKELSYQLGLVKL
jgi:hypothetical protein